MTNKGRVVMRAHQWGERAPHERTDFEKDAVELQAEGLGKVEPRLVEIVLAAAQ